MRVGFFVQGVGPHLDIGKYLVASCKRVMPDVQVFQLTDEKTPVLDGAECIRIDGVMPMAVRRMTHHSRLEGEWLFVDTDCVIRKDVRPVFEEDFEIAVTDRKGSMWEKTPYGMVMPYNMGVTFSRSPSFWGEALKYLKTLPEKFQEWEGDQRVVCEMVRAGFPVKVLPGKVYNYTPEVRGDKALQASILHMKGPRKSWIEDYANDY
jgi:hypothetical protein